MRSPNTPDPFAMRAARQFRDLPQAEFPIVDARLFGSSARGDAGSDSDVDVALILTGPKGRAIEVGPDMAAAGYDAMLDSGMFISPFPIWEEDWRNPEGHSNPWLIRNIQREGVPLER